jgi:2-polyprenyl-3-methyl-5-hydroxy-6-metoxy-1,4-benzoquinol methylase
LGFGASRYLHCSGCHSEFLSPQPDDARLAAIYGPEYYEPWRWEDADVVRDMKAHTFRRALSLLNPASGSRLLDVGCAQGELAEVALSLGLAVTGVDLNAGAIETARARVPRATFVCGELEPSVVGSGWDVVTMFDFIEHVRSPAATLSAAAQILAADGAVLISTPRAGSGVHQLTRRFWPQYREEHLTLFSLAGMRAALNAAGMRIVRVVPTRKYVSFAYLLGQAAAYGPAPTRAAARRARVTLKAGPAHVLLPMRFGEMTVVAMRRPA